MVLDLVSCGLRIGLLSSAGANCFGGDETFLVFTCSASEIPIVFDLVIAGLALLLDPLKDSRPKVFLSNSTPGDDGGSLDFVN